MEQDYTNSIKYLITNYQVINPDLIKEDIEIEIWNHKIIKLDLNNIILNILKNLKI